MILVILAAVSSCACAIISGGSLRRPRPFLSRPRAKLELLATFITYGWTRTFQYFTGVDHQHPYGSPIRAAYLDAEGDEVAIIRWHPFRQSFAAIVGPVGGIDENALTPLVAKANDQLRLIVPASLPGEEVAFRALDRCAELLVVRQRGEAFTEYFCEIAFGKSILLGNPVGNRRICLGVVLQPTVSVGGLGVEVRIRHFLHGGRWVT